MRNSRVGSSESFIIGAIPFDGISVGEAALDAFGAPTSTFKSAPVQISGAFSTPTDGASESVGRWVDVDIPAHRDLLISFRIPSALAGQVRAISNSRMWSSSATPDYNSLAMVSPSITGTWSDWWLEYEYKGSSPHVLYVGDSLTTGSGSTWPFRDGYGMQAALRTNVAASLASVHGSTLVTWLNTAVMRWDAIDVITEPKIIDIGLGSNDINDSRTLDQIQADLGALIAVFRSRFPGAMIVARTIMPRRFDAAREAVRVAFNDWIKTRPFNLAGVFDIVPPVVDPADPSKPIVALTGGDTTHLNSEGYRLIAERFVAPLDG